MMKRNAITINFIFLFFCFSISSSLARSATQILENMKTSYDKAHAICADFNQIFHWKLADEFQKTKGNICIKNGIKFKIETGDQTVITDGKTLWTLNKVNRQVIIDHASSNSNDNPLLKSLIEKYIKNYRAKLDETDSHKGVYHLTLTAKKDDEFYNRIELWVNRENYFISKVVQYDINNNETIYEITKLQLLTDLPDAMFKIKIPDGFQVVDLR